MWHDEDVVWSNFATSMWCDRRHNYVTTVNYLNKINDSVISMWCDRNHNIRNDSNLDGVIEATMWCDRNSAIYGNG